MKASQRSRTARGDKRTRKSGRQKHFGTVLLLYTDTAVRAEMTKLLHSGNYRVVVCGPNQSLSETAQRHSPDLIVIAEAENTGAWAPYLRRLSKADDCPPVVVLGSTPRKTPGGEIADSPVFVRLSSEIDPDDLLGVVAAGIRHRRLQKEKRFLRSEAEQLCSDLISALGDTSEKLTKRNAEVRRVEGILRDAEARILRVFS